MALSAYLANGSFGGELNDTYWDDHGGDEGELVFLCEGPPPSVAVATAASFIAVFCLGVSGNVLLLCTLARCEGLAGVTSLLVANVAASDLAFAATLPFWSVDHLSHWVFGPALCRILIGAYFLGLYCGLMFLTALAVDRYATVVLGKPAASARRLAYARAASVAVWLVGASAAAWEMVTTGTVEVEPGRFECEAAAFSPWGERTACYLQSGLLFLLPLAVVLFCYARILQVTMSRISSTRHRSVTVVLCIVAAFFVCWGPYNLLLVLEASRVTEGWDCDSRARMDLALALARVLAYAHCCVNPVLYAFTFKFRAHLSRLLTGCCPRRLEEQPMRGRERESGAGPCTARNSSTATPKVNRGMELKSLA